MTDLARSRPLRPDAEAALTTGGGGWRGLLWLTLRQHRWLVLGSLVAIAALTVWMQVIYLRIEHLVDQCTPTGCFGSTQAEEILGHGPGAGQTLAIQTAFVMFFPLLFGVLWGAPLVAREYEQRTAALAWSQDVTPTRWLFAKLVYLGIPVAVLAAAPSIVAIRIVDLVHTSTGQSLFDDTFFQVSAGLPVALSIAWFVLGVAASVVLKRTTMAIGLVVTLFVVRVLVFHQFRPRFLPPLTMVQGLDDSTRHSVPDNSLYLSGDGFGSGSVLVDAAGKHHDGMTVLTQTCPPDALPPLGNTTSGALSRGDVRVKADPDQLLACLRGHGFTGLLVEYQPGSRLGTFHLIEAGSSLVVAAVSVLVAWWAIRRSRIV